MCQVTWQVLVLFLPVAATCLWLQVVLFLTVYLYRVEVDMEVFITSAYSTESLESTYLQHRTLQ
jgi:hypothetical protein